ncbi:MAG: ZPR1 zinc finger domain-containing protein [Candidatus Nanoarchaeia archaeon]|nr:ZPR1 zinc finger domain-containing protein [Candidatus Nanoarchaeia archaeon]MDD5239795.1 ZPR1 zinc finger domain-containing protein [Candidatus Nanoarchaeia archaeon]
MVQSATTRTKKFKPFESSFLISCPVCKEKTFTVMQRLDRIPYFGEVLETFASCSNCKYKTSDVLPVEEKKAAALHKKAVSKESHLSLRLVKSKNATVEIPEIGLLIKPGSDSEAFITNIEGMLDRIIDTVGGFKAHHPDKKAEIEKTLKSLQQMKKGKKKFTLIIRDKSGQSAILDEGLKK